MADIGACSSCRLVPLRGVFSCGGWCAGFVARLGSLFLFAVFVSPLLDSNPAWLLGPTANRFAHVIVGEVRFLCCPLGSMLLPVGASPPLLWRVVSVGFSLFLVWTVFAWLSRRVGGRPLWGCSGISRLSTVWPPPVLLRAGRERAIPRLGLCGFRAWWCWGVGDDGKPRDCTRFGCGHGGFLVSGGVFYRVRCRCVCSAVCLSAVSCSVACCWFVAVCVVCLLLCGVRFVSVPARVWRCSRKFVWVRI